MYEQTQGCRAVTRRDQADLLEVKPIIRMERLSAMSDEQRSRGFQVQPSSASQSQILQSASFLRLKKKTQLMPKETQSFAADHL